MRAVRVVALDGPDAVEPTELPEPEPGPGEVLVEVRAVGVNYPDVLMTRGRYQVRRELPFVLGMEFAGVVRSAPPDSGLEPGLRVAGLSNAGTYAELACAPADTVVPLPDEIGFEAAAALPINYLTAHFALCRRTRVGPGDTVLVHGAAGGVGTAATQLAAALGATVVAVASDDAKRKVAERAGARYAIGVEGFKDRVKDLVGGVDVVFDPVGGRRFTDSLRCLNAEGRLLVIGFVDGEIPEVKVNRLLLNNIDVRGVAWGEFALPRPGYVHEQWADLAPLLRDGRLDPIIGGTHPLERAGRALADIEQRRAVGKLVLTVGGGA